MAKKVVKKRTTKSEETKTRVYKTKDLTRGRKEPSKKSTEKMDNKTLIICLVAYVALLVLFYFQLGLFFTVFTAIGILMIVGIAKVLEKLKRNKKRRRIVNIVLIIFLALGILGLIAVSAFLVFVMIKAPKFDPERLNKPEISILYDKDGNEITKMGSEQREKVTYDELPQVLIDAIVATEDSRFFQHNGFDAPRFMVAAFGQLAGKNAGGASTLSMQVIKNTISTKETRGIEGIIRKFSDIYLAVFKLEKNYSKEEIIEFYVNNHFLGGNIYGVEEASLAYFNKHVGDLNLAEAATLAGMFQSPNAYRPTTNPEQSEKRRKTVLYLMKRHGYITEEEEDLANAIPISSLTADATGVNSGVHQYQGYIDTVVEELKDKYGVNPYTTPLLVYTNLDRQKQDGVDRVMRGETYTWVDDVVQSGVSVLDSETGKILAIGAGRNKTVASGFNYAADKKMKRQAGSTAKPLFDYGPLIEYNNASTYGYNKDGTYYPFVDEPYSYTNGKSIQNWDGSFMGTMSMRRALALSRNIPAVKAFQQVDNKKIIEFVTSLGIQPEIENGRIHEAHALGAFNGVNPVQMSAAYAAFSNGGYYNEPYSVSKIEYRSTGEVEEHKSEKKRVMSDSTAYMIASILQDVNISSSPIPNVAAKTGTTNYDAETIRKNGLPSDAIGDSWVIGFTTKTVIGMWYGYDDIDPVYVSRNVPATIQRDLIFRALANGVFEQDKTPFKQPDSVVKLPIIAGSNPAIVANEGEGNVVYEYFKKGHEPKNVQQQVTKLATPSNFRASFDGTNKVTLSWSAVNPGETNEGYGAFGYNIYFGDTLLAFTDKTSYTYTTNNPYGTYRVIATFRSYTGNQSGAATFTLKEPVPEIKLSVEYSGDAIVPADGTLTLNANDFTVYNNGVVVNSAKVTILTNQTITTPGIYQVECEVSYNGTTEKFTLTIEATAEETDSGP